VKNLKGKQDAEDARLFVDSCGSGRDLDGKPAAQEGAGNRSGLGRFRARSTFRRFVSAPFGPETIRQILHRRALDVSPHSSHRRASTVPDFVPALRSDASRHIANPTVSRAEFAGPSS
jgi:hypothetical protein